MGLKAVRTAVFALGLALVSVTSHAPVAAAATATVMTLTVAPTTVLEGNSVTVTATVRTAGGAPVTSGTVYATQNDLFSFCEGPSGAPVDASGRATLQLPIPDGAPGAGDVDVSYTPADASYQASEATAQIGTRWVMLPSELHAGGGSTDGYSYLSASPDAMWHWSCYPDDEGVDGEVRFYEGAHLLATGYGGAYRSADENVALPMGLHQIRVEYAPHPYAENGPSGWSGNSDTFNMNVTGAGTTFSTRELAVNPSFETDTAGWTSLNGTVSRVVRAGAPQGAAVAKATRTTGTSYTLTDTGAPATPTVRATTAGATYIGSASVASASSGAVGKPITLVLRERTPAGSLVKETWVRTTLSTAFKRLKVSAKAAATGNTIGIRLEQSSASSGHAFFADALSVRHAAEIEGLNGYSLTNDDRGTVWTPLTADAKRASRTDVTTAIEATALSAYLDGKGATTGTQTVKGVIYRDAGGSPGSLVATTGQVTIRAGAADTFVELPFASPVSLPTGSYWFGLHTGGTTRVARYLATETPAALRTNVDTYSDGAAATFGSAPTQDDKGIVMYATGAAQAP